MTAEEYYRTLSDQERVEKAEALKLLEFYMRDHGLDGWKGEIPETVVHGLAAQSDEYMKVIRLSEWWACHVIPAKLRETILHEIAHAVSGVFGHGKAWEAKALELGVSSEHILSVRRALDEVLAGPTEEDKALWRALSEEEKERRRKMI